MFLLRAAAAPCIAFLSFSALAASTSDPLKTAAAAMNALLASPAAVRAGADDFRSVRKRYECVDRLGTRAESVERGDTSATVLLDVDARATLPVTHAACDFPSNWLVRLRKREGRWQVERVWTPESDVVARLEAASDSSARLAILGEQPRTVTPELARLLSERGHALVSRARVREAADLDELALVVAAETHSAAETARALTLQGRTLDWRNQFRAAMAVNQAARLLAEKTGDMGLLASAVLGIATQHQRVDEPYVKDAAEAYRLADLAGEDRVAGAAMFLLAVNDHGAGRYASAIKEFDETARRAKRCGDPQLEAVAVAQTGIAYEYIGNQALGFEFLFRAIEMFRKAGNMRGVVVNLRTVADMEAVDHLYDRADKHLRQAEELLVKYPSPYTSAYVAATHGSIALARNDLAAAERFDVQAIDLAKRTGIQYLVTVGVYHLAELRLKQKRYADAVSLATEAIERAVSVLPPVYETYLNAQVTRGQALLALGRVDDARRSYESAIAAIEQTRPEIPAPDEDQQLFLTDKDKAYYEMARTFIGRDPAEALLWVERSRARTLIEFLSHGHRKSIKSLSEEERADEARIEKAVSEANVALRDARAQKSPDSAQIERLEKTLTELRHRRAVLIRELYDRHPDLAMARGDIPLPPVGEMRAAIPPDAVILEYFALPDGAWVIGVTRDAAPRVIPIHATDEKLQALTGALSKAIARRDARVFAQSRALYDLLLRPAEDLLRGKKAIGIVPDATLRDLPFSMLASPGGAFLIEKYAVFTAPSLAFLHWRSKHRAGGGDRELLAMANPTISAATASKVRERRRGEALGALPEAEQEVRALASIYGRARTTLRIGAAATEKEFKRSAGRYRILHLATHGMYDDSDPMYSHLLLARTGRDDDEDGLLEAREIEDLELHADLAVLSACETGRTTGSNGEGMMGLSWAFLGAGCPATVVSLWSVESAATARLMIDFHRHLARGDSVPEALRRAEVALLRQRRYHHPYYWAPFVAAGAP